MNIEHLRVTLPTGYAGTLAAVALLSDSLDFTTVHGEDGRVTFDIVDNRAGRKFLRFVENSLGDRVEYRVDYLSGHEDNDE